MNLTKAENRLWVITRLGEMPLSQLWYGIVEHLDDNMKDQCYTVSGGRPNQTTEEIGQQLANAKPSHGEIVGDFWKLSFNQNPPHNFDQLFVDGPADWLTEDLIDVIFSATLDDFPGFVQAFLVDKRFERLQNMQDPLEFEAEGISIDGLKLISNGLPHPLERQIIDTSSNPGRYKLCAGHVEAVASAMWFGQLFWDRVGRSRGKAESLLQNVIRTSGSGLMRISATIDDLDTIRNALYGG